jgi:hypothetical protein
MVKTTRPYAEEHIWHPIAVRPLGYRGAVALHQVQIGNQSGYVDLILLPKGGQKKLVLVEAKRADDRRSSADVVGQLLKYYAHALDLGSDGLRAFLKCAHGERPSRLVSFKRALECASLSEAQARAGAGVPLRADDIQLVVAVDRDARKFAPRLLKIVRLLHGRHRIPIAVALVDGDRPRWLHSQPMERDHDAAG